MPWDPRLSARLDAVEARWIAIGLSPLACGELRARLVEDLVGAVLSGAPVEELVAGEADRFADDVAVAAGYDVERPGRRLPDPAPAVALTVRNPLAGLGRRTRFVLSALAGAVVGAALGWWTVVRAGFDLIDAAFPSGIGLGEGVAAVCLWAGYAVVVAAVAGVAVLLQFRDTRLGLWASAAMLVSGAAITLPTIAFASTTDYDTAPAVVMLEAAMVLVALAAGLVAASGLTLRRAADPG